VIKNGFLLLFSVILLSGCLASGLFGKREDSLNKTVSFYYNMLMWKYYDRASAFVDDEKRYKFEELVVNSQDNLNITSYQIKEVVFFEGDKDKSMVRVLINYYKYPSVSEKTILLEDTWVYREGKWYISSDFDEAIYN
jgi:hypothetical protein